MIRKILPVVILITIVLVAIGLLSIGRGSDKPEQPAEASAANNNSILANSTQTKLDPAKIVSFPLSFPITGFRSDMVLSIPESRLPGASRSYRGSNARHQGVDFYTGKCNLPVKAPADGWIIDLNSKEPFPSASVRDSILEVVTRAGFTPDPVLDNLNGTFLVIYHGWDKKGKCYYSRLSHFEKLERNFQIGDFVKRGEVVGYVGASGTSAQFKTGSEKTSGCHLHFEWHEISGGEDRPLGFDERDVNLKRKLYYKLFSPDE